MLFIATVPSLYLKYMPFCYVIIIYSSRCSCNVQIQVERNVRKREQENVILKLTYRCCMILISRILSVFNRQAMLRVYWIHFQWLVCFFLSLLFIFMYSTFISFFYSFFASFFALLFVYYRFGAGTAGAAILFVYWYPKWK